MGLKSSGSGWVLWCLLCGTAIAQVRLHGHVVDRAGGVVAGIVIERDGLPSGAISDGSGNFAVETGPLPPAGAKLRARGAGMESAVVRVTHAGEEIALVVGPSALMQQAIVTATRTAVDVGPMALTQSTLAGKELTRAPGLTLDESLRQHAGFELFRRSSGWVQNPTSQGISLRGLGSTAASRSLVLANSAPLNDAFGGWVHWNELPPGAIDAVTITSGGGSDLYGSSALGGVIDVVPARPVVPLGEVQVAAAGEDTRSASVRGDVVEGPWRQLLAAEDFRTAGYTLVASSSRGAVDVPANVHFETGRFEADRILHGEARLFMTGNVLNEARGNGTPLTTNGTRLWRYLAGDDWSAGDRVSGRARVFGSDEAYRQSFSAIPAGRRTETLSRRQRVEAQEVGASADASVHWSGLAMVGGVDARDLRATDAERPTTGAAQVTSARQRFVGGFGEVLAGRRRWSGAASLRLDSAANLDTRQFAGTVPSALVNRGEIVASPRVGLVRQIGRQVTIHASGFRAFRTPTMNELYRTGQVGQEVTLPNAALVSERATGAEGGATVRAGRVSVQAAYFWTGINRPVAAVLVSSTATGSTLMRRNLGQIQSQGVEVSAQVNEGHAVSGGTGYQFAHAVVTSFPAQTALVGKCIPDVVRESATAQVHLRNARVGEASLLARYSGRAFDDTANTFVLHGFFELDASGSREIGRGFTAFVSLQNVLGRRADVSRTPVLTQGIPFVAQGGVRFGWGGTHSR